MIWQGFCPSWMQLEMNLCGHGRSAYQCECSGDVDRWQLSQHHWSAAWHVFTLGSVLYGGGGIGVFKFEESIVCHGPIGGPLCWSLCWALVVSRCACRHVMALPIPCRYSCSCMFIVVGCHHSGACTMSGVHVGSRGVGASGAHSDWLDWLELTLIGGGVQRCAC